MARDSSRATFAHEAKQLVKLLRDWPAPLENYFEISEGANYFTACPKMESRHLGALDFSVIVLPDYFFSAASQVLSWTMADSSSDLPFYKEDDRGSSLPSTFQELFISCYEAAKMQCILSFLQMAGSVHQALTAMRRISEYLQGKMPRLVIKGTAVENPLDWTWPEFSPSLVDFSRLMMVILREAIQHGSWIHEVVVSIEILYDGTLWMEAVNGLRDGDESLFLDLPEDLPLQKEDFEFARNTLHTRNATFSPIGRQGRRQVAFLAASAGGSLIFSDRNNAFGRHCWMVQCEFRPLNYSRSNGRSAND